MFCVLHRKVLNNLHQKTIINTKLLIMKFKNLLTLAVVTLTLFMTSCDKENGNRSNIIPTKFKVDIPNSISNASGSRAASSDTIKGEVIYDHMGNFIHIGEAAADVVQDIMIAIARYDLSQAVSFTYTSDEDGKEKDVVVIEGASFEGVNYEYRLTLSDMESVGNDDEGKAIQIFWNTNPVKGIALLKPSNINEKDRTHENAIYKIEYSEAGELGYDAHMVVSIADLSLASPLDDPYSVSGLKMFVGAKGSIIDVYGNSAHPNATFFDSSKGFNWAFVASGDENKDIAVAEVGLPSNELESTDRGIILEDNSIKNVFTNQILSLWPTLTDSVVDAYLTNTQAPAYFDANGFIQAGSSPSQEYSTLEANIETLIPYSPKTVSELTLDFQ